MRINIIILVIFFFITPVEVIASDIYIYCKDVDWIEIRKTPHNMPMSIQGFRGNCSGSNCFLICMHLSDSGFIDLYTQLSDNIGNIPNIYIEKELIWGGISIDFIPPIEFYGDYKGVDDSYAFSNYEEAEKRAFTICPSTTVKYTGIMGKKNDDYYVTP